MTKKIPPAFEKLTDNISKLQGAISNNINQKSKSESQPKSTININNKETWLEKIKKTNQSQIINNVT